LTANHKILLHAEKLQSEGKDASIVKKVRDGAVLFSSSSKWHRVILDEAQNIKNPNAKSTKACSRLDATYRWCLTGTPMMNRLEDFQSLLGFLRIRPYNNKEKFKRVSYLHNQQVTMSRLKNKTGLYSTYEERVGGRKSHATTPRPCQVSLFASYKEDQD
jgi:hypothetical protein